MTDYLTDAQNDVKAYFESHDIPKYFYQCFFGELVKIFGGNLIIPDTDYLAEYDDDGNIIPSEIDDYSYKDQLGYYLTCFSGTAGWAKALEESFLQCRLTQLKDGYSKMCHVRSDIFDGYLADQMLDVIFAEDKASDYYFYKVKENNE